MGAQQQHPRVCSTSTRDCCVQYNNTHQNGAALLVMDRLPHSRSLQWSSWVLLFFSFPQLFFFKYPSKLSQCQEEKKSPHISPHTSLIAFDGGKTGTKLSELWTLIKITTQENSTFVAQSRWVEKKENFRINRANSLLNENFTINQLTTMSTFVYDSHLHNIIFFGDFSSFTWLNALGREKKIFSISLITNRRNHIKSQIHTITSPNTVRLKTRKKLFLFWFPRKYNRKKNPKLLIDIFFHKANARSRDSYSLSDACRSTKDWLTRAPLKQKKNHHHIKSVILTLSPSSPFSLLFVHIIVAAAALCCVLSVCSASYRLFYGGREDEGKHGWESERVSESGVGFM